MADHRGGFAGSLGDPGGHDDPEPEPTPENIAEAYTTKEAAEELGMNLRTLQNWCKQGWVKTIPDPHAGAAKPI